MIVGIKTQNKRIQQIADIPILGGIFTAILIFVPPVLFSFASQTAIPALQNNLGFAKIFIFALPVWNLLMWLLRLKLYLLFIPAWLLLGSSSIYRGFITFSGEKPGKILPSDEVSVWKNLYQKTTYDNQRIALIGYIKLANLTPVDDKYACNLVDNNGNLLTGIILGEKAKNAIEIYKKNENKIDEAKSFLLDNDGNKLPIGSKVLVSFKIKYDKADSGEYVPLIRGNSMYHLGFKNVAKPGEKYYFFRTQDIRIDKNK